MKKSISIIWTICLIISCIVLTSCNQRTITILSKSEITNFRKNYPLISVNRMSFDYPMLDLDARLAFLPYLAEIEVTKVLPDYTVEVEHETSTTESYKTTLLFHQYEVKVHNTIINRTEHELPETITLCFADAFSESYPSLAVGTKLVASLEPAKGSHAGSYIFYDNTLFYVTNNDYILSVYTENENDIDLTGYTKHDFIDQISQMLADNE